MACLCAEVVGPVFPIPNRSRAVVAEATGFEIKLPDCTVTAWI